MKVWWYAGNDKKNGPIEFEELNRLIQIGKVGANTSLWTEGMEAWQPLHEIKELRALMAAVPPPLPPKIKPDPLTYPLANRWPRFFARMFDLWWEVLLIAFCIGFALSRYSATFVEWVNSASSGYVFGFLCLPIALVVDAFVHRIFGNTPAKAMLGLRVEKLSGETLTLSELLFRNVSIWGSGFAVGLPVVWLFTMAQQANRLKKGQQTSYDESYGLRVKAKPIGWPRRVFFGVSFLILCAVMVALQVEEQKAQHEAVLYESKDDYWWKNPITARFARVDPKWKDDVILNEDGQRIHTFSERTDHALVIFAKEDAPSYSMNDYVQSFRKSNVSKMRFSDDGRFFMRGGNQAWEASGNIIDDLENRMSVLIVKLDSGFWRVVTVQAMPYNYSDAFVGELRDSLWRTVE